MAPGLQPPTEHATPPTSNRRSGWLQVFGTGAPRDSRPTELRGREQPRKPVRAPARGEILEVPPRTSGPGTVGALEEREERLSRIVGNSDRVVWKEGERSRA